MKFFFTFFFHLLITALNGQIHTQLIVLESDVNSPISAARIILLQSGIELFTNYNGLVKIDSENDSVEVIACYIGFRAESKILTNKKNADTIILKNGYSDDDHRNGQWGYYSIYYGNLTLKIIDSIRLKRINTWKIESIVRNENTFINQYEPYNNITVNKDTVIISNSMHDPYRDYIILNVNNFKSKNIHGSILINDLDEGINEIYLSKNEPYWFQDFFKSINGRISKIEMPLAVIIK